MPNPMPSRFALTKDWRDAEPGIEVVDIRFAWAPLGEQPDWSQAENSCVLVPRDQGPLCYRSAAIELPCGLDGNAPYSFHYYFLVIRNGKQSTSGPVVEDIVSREIAYSDRLGQVASAAIQWGNSNALPLNYTPLTAIPQHTISRKAATARAEQSSILVDPMAAVPHCFKGLVWGPSGTSVQYFVQYSRDEESKEQFWDTNNGKGWTLALA